MNCLIIAAGEGSRLRDVSVSKPLTPVAGVPLIERVLRAAAGGGATDHVLEQRYPADGRERLGVRQSPQAGAEARREDQAVHSAASASPAMNSSVSWAAISSLNCCGGCLQK